MILLRAIFDSWLLRYSPLCWKKKWRLASVRTA